MKIKAVTANNRKHRFEVDLGRRGVLGFPYTRCNPGPTPADRVVDVHVDDELGREGFTYLLASGVEGSVMVDFVLDHNADPAYVATMELHRLTLEAKDRFERSGRTARDAAAALGTSPTQLYRLLDPTNYAKSAHQLLALLALVGCEVTVVEAKASA